MTTFQTGLTVDLLDAATRLIENARQGILDGELEDTLDALLRCQLRIESALRGTVREMREHEWTWQQIGDQLGVSRQAVQERFGAGPSGSRS